MAIKRQSKDIIFCKLAHQVKWNTEKFYSVNRVSKNFCVVLSVFIKKSCICLVNLRYFYSFKMNMIFLL